MREPARFPWRLSDQLCSASATAASPELYASLEFSRHQGAWTSFCAFHSRRSAYRFQPRRGFLTSPNMHSSNSRSAMDARTCSSPAVGGESGRAHVGGERPLLRGGRVQGKAVCLMEPHVPIIAHPFALAGVPLYPSPACPGKPPPVVICPALSLPPEQFRNPVGGDRRTPSSGQAAEIGRAHV